MGIPADFHVLGYSHLMSQNSLD